jgi:hypothetical protein
VSLYIFVLVEIGAFMLVVGLPNLLIHLMSILAHDYLLVILSWSLYEDSLLFCMSWHDDGV